MNQNFQFSLKNSKIIKRQTRQQVQEYVAIYVTRICTRFKSNAEEICLNRKITIINIIHRQNRAE